MDSISHDVFLCILDFIGDYPEDFLPYVTVSRRWQIALERPYFMGLRIENTDLPTFANLFRPSEAHRKAFVEKIRLNFILPEYDGEDCQQHKEANNKLCSDNISQLFQVLETFNNDKTVLQKGGGINLNLSSIRSPSDVWDDKNTPELCKTFIQLLEHEKLPILSCVSRFSCGYITSSRRFDPPSMVRIASKLKGLKQCKIYYANNPKYIDFEAQKEIRQGIVKVLPTLPSSLDTLSITFQGRSPHDETESPPDFVPASSQGDPFNYALHRLIQDASLSSLAVAPSHVISPDFFWPYKDASIPAAATKTTPFWPNLKKIFANCSATSPDGDWYFLGDPDIVFLDEDLYTPEQKQHWDKDSENTFRNIPNEARINPLLIAMAHAVRHAPVVKNIFLSFPTGELFPRYSKDRKELLRRFTVEYFAAGVDDFAKEDSEDPVTANARLLLKVGDWRPSEEVERHWRDALGPNGVISYSWGW